MDSEQPKKDIEIIEMTTIRKRDFLIHHRQNRINTLFKHLRQNQLLPCIYFSFSRVRTEIFAQELALFNFLSKEERGEITDKAGQAEVYSVMGQRVHQTKRDSRRASRLDGTR